MERISDYGDLIRRHFQNGKLIPFLGAGFTRNEKSKGTTVPDGNTFVSLMISMLMKEKPALDRKKLLADSFSDISDLFYRHVPENDIDQVLKDYFTAVKISNEDKLKFLSHSWQYIYTLNIDDGIENNSGYKKVLPNREIKINNLSEYRFVYKLHGDAMDAITYKNSKSVIFSKGQYLKSLKENSAMLAKLKSDYIQNNIIFIGCSLNDEIDLRLIIEELRDESYGNINDLIILTNNDYDENQKLKLEALGINKYIVEDYRVFYERANIVLDEIAAQKDTLLSKYKNQQFGLLGTNHEKNLRSLYRDYSYEAIDGKKIQLPHYLIRRNVETKLDFYLGKKETFFYILGKRCSGKTLLVFSFIKKLANRDYYYFPAKISISNESIGSILSIKNALVVFDSNSITSDQIQKIQSYESQIAKNNSMVLFVVNASDRIFASLMISYFGDNEIELANKLTSIELSEINARISECQIANFDNSNTLIDNILRIERMYGIFDKHIEANSINDLNKKELIVLILLTTFSKIYFSELLQYGFEKSDVASILKKYAPFVDLEDTSLIENAEHSQTKIVANSSIGLLSIVHMYYAGNDRSRTRILDSIKEIVGTSLKARNNKYKNVIMFDNLNQIFSSSLAGARRLILELYDGLEAYLAVDWHYWIQRAKAIYHMEPNNIQSLRKAKIYALKAFSDSDEGSRLNTISKFTLARIIGRITRLANYVDEVEVREAVNFYYKCLIENISEDEYSRDLLDEAKKRKNRSDLYHLVISYRVANLKDSQAKQELIALYNIILK